MNIVFCSNFMNHHQNELSMALKELCKGTYYFIACEPVYQEQLNLGYEDMNEKYDFVIRPYENQIEQKKAETAIKNCDVVIFTSGDEKYFRMAIKLGKLVFKASERILKRGVWFRYFIPKMIRTYSRYTKYKKKKNFYVLCSSAYTSYDLSLSGFHSQRCFKWGYFPEAKKHNIEALISNKNKGSILWVGRFIDWKHPEIPVLLAEKLKREGYEFELNMIGTGKMYSKIEDLIKQKKLSDKVKLSGAMSPENVRKYMERSSVCLLTSSFKEGWGAVLNEAMNSGCACVVSHATGAVPYLIKNGVNGLVYKYNDFNEMYEKTVFILQNHSIRENMGSAAYRTLYNVWNAKVAAQRVIEFADSLLRGECYNYNEGPCSRAEVIPNNWYRGK